MGWIQTILTLVFITVGGLMTLLILIQEGKGGGLAALGGTKAAGVEGVTNPVRRATGYLAAMLFGLAILLGFLNRPTASKFQEAKEDKPSIVAPATTDAPKAGDAAKPADVKPVDATKPVEVKPADATKPVDVNPADAIKPADAPKADAPKPDAPKVDAPKADAPKPADTPKADSPKEAPKP